MPNLVSSATPARNATGLVPRLNPVRVHAEEVSVVSPQRRNASSKPRPQRPQRPTPSFVAERIRLAEHEVGGPVKPMLTLVVPMFREADRIARSLIALQDAGLDGIELLLVDDGSTDDTVAVANACIAELDLRDASVLALAANVGKGGAVRAGILEARTPYVGFVDADLSLDPLEIRRALNRLHLTRGDIVVGERIIDPQTQPRLRRIASLVFRRLTDSFAPTGVRDPQCALKVFRRDVAFALFDALDTDGYSFDVEVLLRARSAGYTIDEMAVRWTHQPGSKVHPIRDSFRMLGEVRRIGRNLRPSR